MVSLPRLSSKLITQWIAVTIVLSLVAALDGGFVARWCVLTPSRVLHGEVWRLVTWPLVEPGPIALLMSCASIFKFGGELAERWGDARLQRFMTEVIIAASAVSCVIAALAGQSYLVHRLGGWVVANALVIGWARQYPQRSLSFSLGMFLPRFSLGGDRLVWLVTGFSILTAVYGGLVYFAPEALTCIAAMLYPRARLAR